MNRRDVVHLDLYDTIVRDATQQGVWSCRDEGDAPVEAAPADV